MRFKVKSPVLSNFISDLLCFAQPRDFFGWDELSVQYYDETKVDFSPVKVFGRCLDKMADNLALEIRSIMQSYGYKRWAKGHFDLESRYAPTLFELEEVVAQVTNETLGMEGNVWKDNGGVPGEGEATETKAFVVCATFHNPLLTH